MKQKIRIAQIKLDGIKKRCRKSSYEIIQAIGLDNDEAIANLKVKLNKAIESYKTYTFHNKVKIFDGERDFYSGYSSLGFSMFPTVESDNLQFIDFILN